jgi:tetratricopeptide (TPR) repeat protein
MNKISRKLLIPLILTVGISGSCLAAKSVLADGIVKGKHNRGKDSIAYRMPVVAKKELMSDACVAFGDSCYGKGDYSGAIHYYSRALRLLEGAKIANAQIYEKLCGSYLRRSSEQNHGQNGDVQKALEYNSKAVQKITGAIDCVILGAHEFEKGNYSQAREFFKQSLRLDSKCDDARQYLKLVEEKIGKERENKIQKF